jgi:hypothetical protein
MARDLDAFLHDVHFVVEQFTRFIAEALPTQALKEVPDGKSKPFRSTTQPVPGEVADTPTRGISYDAFATSPSLGTLRRAKGRLILVGVAAAAFVLLVAVGAYELARRRPPRTPVAPPARLESAPPFAKPAPPPPPVLPPSPARSRDNPPPKTMAHPKTPKPKAQPKIEIFED